MPPTFIVTFKILITFQLISWRVKYLQRHVKLCSLLWGFFVCLFVVFLREQHMLYYVTDMTV